MIQCALFIYFQLLITLFYSLISPLISLSLFLSPALNLFLPFFPYILYSVGVEADCVEGLYNLGLVNLKLNAELEAHNAFDKLHTILPR